MIPESDFSRPCAPSLKTVRAHATWWIIDIDGDLWACTWWDNCGFGWNHWLRDTGVRPLPEDVVADIARMRSSD